MSRRTSPLLFSVVTLLLLALPLRGQDKSPQAILQEAEQAYAQHTYRTAAELYGQLLTQDPPPAGITKDQLTYRHADATWRNLSATQQTDWQVMNAPRESLTELAKKLQKEAKGARTPQLWAEIQESLGDSFWVNEQFRNWNQAWNYYAAALDWWGGSTNLDLARERYLAIIFRAARPPQVQPYWRYGYNFGNWIPDRYLDNAITIAQSDENKAHANYLLGASLVRNGGENALKAGESFQTALSYGEKTEWADGALYEYAQWAERFGSSRWDQNGRFIQEGDLTLALNLYRQFVERYPEGDSRFYGEAKNQISSITEISLSVMLHDSFLPNSEYAYDLAWRNIDTVKVGIYPIDLSEAFQPNSDEHQATPFGDFDYDLSGKTPVATLEKKSSDVPYAQQREHIRVEEGLEAGAYVIEATGGGKTEQTLMLVTDQQVTILRDSNIILAWATSAITGEPVAGAEITTWLGHSKGSGSKRMTDWVSATRTAGEDGIARFTAKDFGGLTGDMGDYSQLIVISEKEKQTTAATRNRYYNNHRQPTWRVYAFTDRPAYRPEDTINWKATVRMRETLNNWRTPANQSIYYRINGPQGDQVAEGTMSLNEYGSIWGELKAEESWKLGMYNVQFRVGNENGDYIGGAELFRLEEYKLPEYKVAVSTVSEDGESATAYRLGDDVQVEIQADYYFGGAVTNAEVNIVVRESPYYHYWQPPTPYPWYRDRAQSYRHYGGGSVVLNEKLKTDAEGRAILTLPTKASSSYDLQYTIEARVVDESRREVSGSANIRVTRAPYSIYLNPERTLYRPGETASITIKALNANDDPVEVAGRVRLTRQEWMAVWRGPDGEEISGQEFDRRRKKSAGLFTSALNPTEWTKVREGYDIEEIKVVNLKTNADGEATFEFPVTKTGYYRVYWVSRPERMAPIKVDAAVWVADSASQNIGYHGELKIVADADSFREGQRTPVMVTTPEAGRWVLFSVQGGGLIDARVIYLEGNVKLLEYDVDEQWIPNAWLQANAAYNLRMHQDRIEVVVPPDKHFLEVNVVTNAENYLPREKAKATITTRDVNGRPVAAEVALSIFDEAVLAIQPTLAPDPREFFYGEKRPDTVSTFSSQANRRFYIPPAVKVAVLDIDFDVSVPYRMRGESLSEGGADPFAAPSAAAAMDSFSDSDGGRGMMLGLSAKSVSAPMGRAEAQSASSPAAQPTVVVRHDFRSTIFWQPAIMTDANGHAQVDFELPDNLTTWELEARAVGLPASFGQGETQVKSRLPLIARLQTPRFLVTGDQLTLTGVINNNTDEPMKLSAELEIVGGLEITNAATQKVDVPAQGSAQVNWPVSVKTPGDAVVTLTARSSSHADAMKLTIPVYEHGIDKFMARSGKMTTDSLKLKMNIPKFRAEGADFKLYLSPSIATTMLDALPYLAQYPYGCTEQTMSRFLPAVIVAKTLGDVGLPVKDIMQKNFGGIEATTPDKIIQQSKPKKEGDLTNLDEMVTSGMTRLLDFQHSDGGWGWWKGGSSDPYMSAYVVWGLTLAQQAGRNVDSKALDRGREYLGLRLVDFEERYDMQAWLLHALAAADRGQISAKPDKYEAKAFANLWKNRDQLNAYTRALTALSAKWLGFTDEARILAENLANGVVLDENPQGSILLPANAAANTTAPTDPTILKTAHWGEDGIYWRWSNGGVESTAFALMALVEITPDSELIEPTMNWLVKNRRGAQWSNTRDTAIVVMALNEWLRKSGELEASGEYTAMLNGKSVGDINVTPATVLTGPRVLNLPVKLLKEGENTITLQRKAGKSPLYFSARLNFFTLEDPIAPAGNELFVRRQYERTYPVKTLLDGYDSRSAPLLTGGVATSGDRIEAIVTVEAKNNLEYILIEDLKPAGFEAVALQSGAPLYAKEVRPGSLNDVDRYTGRTQWVYQELRDRQIACFIDKLPQGLWEIRYELRAETPGKFSALPVKGEAMYVPEIKANSAEIKVTVQDK